SSRGQAAISRRCWSAGSRALTSTRVLKPKSPASTSFLPSPRAARSLRPSLWSDYEIKLTLELKSQPCSGVSSERRTSSTASQRHSYELPLQERVHAHRTARRDRHHCDISLLCSCPH